MTREEAIKWLEYSKDNYEGLDYGAPRIALYMAIAALRAQESGSFQNGNDHNTVKDWTPYMDLPRERDVTDINVGNKWISVEEKLPEESAEVLSFFCVRKIDGTWERCTATAIRLCDAKWLVSDYQNGIEAYSWGADIEDCCFRVTHWMPLPEPPKED